MPTNRRLINIALEKGRKVALSRLKPTSRPERGQALVLLAVSFLALLAFIGLVTDAGSLYITYTQLKRAVDAAAVAAANNVKISTPGETYQQQKERVTEAARELLSLNNIEDLESLEVYLCDDVYDLPPYPAPTPTIPQDFIDLCPQLGESPRKLAYVEAVQNAPVFFLHLFGVPSVQFSTSAVGEAATVDLVLVIDTSESMASDIDCGTDNSCTPGYVPYDFDPTLCNAASRDPDLDGLGACYPLHQAKDAADSLIARLLPGYDQVAIVNYDYRAYRVPINGVFGLSSDIGSARDAIYTIDVHDDAPAARLEWSKPSPMGGYRRFNPIFPDDRDGDGLDADPGAPCIDEYDYRIDGPGKDLWDDDSGEPCDDDDILDAYDWNGDGDYSNDHDEALTKSQEQNSQVSTCIGCGIRLATEVLRDGGRADSIWVMVFLSDGIANLSDTNATSPDVPAGFLYGFCGDDPSNSFWDSYCIDTEPANRYCIDTNPQTCPPHTNITTQSGPYSVVDYAYDMADNAAYFPNFQNRTPDPNLYNLNEPKGEDMIIYSVALGAASSQPHILRYMANLGDDNERYSPNDPCGYALPVPGVTPIPTVRPTTNCGNYYYAPTGAYLDQIFENIASRIFTKISR